MNNITKENEISDITAREFILLGAMLVITILAIIGIFGAISDFASSSLWNMLSLDKLLDAFEQLLGKLVC